MQRLAPFSWLTDNIMNTYAFMIRFWDAERRANGSGEPPVHVFPTFFFDKLLEPQKRNKYLYQEVKRWGKKIKSVKGDIFKLRMLLVFVHINGNTYA